MPTVIQCKNCPNTWEIPGKRIRKALKCPDCGDVVRNDRPKNTRFNECVQGAVVYGVNILLLAWAFSSFVSPHIPYGQLYAGISGMWQRTGNNQQVVTTPGASNVAGNNSSSITYVPGTNGAAPVHIGYTGPKLQLKQTSQEDNYISAGMDHTVGLKPDGTVIAVGSNNTTSYDNGQCNISGWRDIVTIVAGGHHTVGLKSNGTVIAIGNNLHGQCNTGDWHDIVAVSAGSSHTVGLKSDGTVIAIGDNKEGQCDTSNWGGIIAVSAGSSHTVGLRSDGSVIAIGGNKEGQCNVSGWRNIIAISAGGHHTVGLKGNGTVVAIGRTEERQCDVDRWYDIVAISAGMYQTVGLTMHGTVVAVGRNTYGECNTDRWHNIVAISSRWHTVGLRSDGTVVAVGDNRATGRCDTGDWQGIGPGPFLDSDLAKNEDKVIPDEVTELEGTWRQHIDGREACDFAVTINNMTGQYEMTGIKAYGSFGPSRGITDVRYDGETWSFNSDWGYKVAKFVLRKTDDDTFEGMVEGNQRNKWVRVRSLPGDSGHPGTGNQSGTGIGSTSGNQPGGETPIRPTPPNPNVPQRKFPRTADPDRASDSTEKSRLTLVNLWADLQEYREDNGRFPARLSDLTPRYTSYTGIHSPVSSSEYTYTPTVPKHGLEILAVEPEVRWGTKPKLYAALLSNGKVVQGDSLEAIRSQYITGGISDSEVSWSMANWSYVEFDSAPFGKHCRVLLSTDNDKFREKNIRAAFAGVGVGPVAESRSDKAYVDYRDEVHGYLREIVKVTTGASAPKKQNDLKFHGNSYECYTTVYKTDHKLPGRTVTVTVPITVLTGVENGRCVAYWFFNTKSSCYLSAVGQARIKGAPALRPAAPANANRDTREDQRTQRVQPAQQAAETQAEIRARLQREAEEKRRKELAKITGKVIDVQDDLLSIDIGSAMGVQEGMRMVIHRKDQFVSYLRIEMVEKDEAVGVIVDKQIDPQKGDEVFPAEADLSE